MEYSKTNTFYSSTLYNFCLLLHNDSHCFWLNPENVKMPTSDEMGTAY
jgi:hypothetical protein